MKWIYGKHDWETLERGEENCYLMTNALGGFSSMTMTGSVSRNDHTVLMACMKAPNHRYNLVHRLKEQIVLKGDGTKRSYILSSQEFADGHREEGYRYLSSFTYEDTPVWRFHTEGIEIQKEAGLKPGANTAALCYEIENRGKEPCTFYVTPFFQFVPKGCNMDTDQRIEKDGNRITSNGMVLFFRTNGEIMDIADTVETYYYRYDKCDGRRESGTAKANHQISLSVKPGEKRVLEIIFEIQCSKENALEIIDSVKKSRREWEKHSGFITEVGKTLAKSASQFISKRESTGGYTILAGYPFFEDWGRDTMIALPGLCITTGQYQIAKEILRTFAVNEKNGLMPNLFPEGRNEPLYNTADAALLFINCVYLYYAATKDIEFLKEVYPVMERIMQGYQRGTAFGIYMDGDGLIQAGEELAQVTWMDVRIGDILPTPRHGKPVEINAYWYNALRIMELFAALLAAEEKSSAGMVLNVRGRTNPVEYAALAEKVRDAFEETFWLEEEGCLKDVISDTVADGQIRCNQIWAVSMPFTMLNREKEKQIVETVFEKLYTPYGLRTLEEGDREFHPYYKGPMEERDMAYHQGTVWTFPLGAYYLAYLKVHDYSEKAKRTVKEQMEVMEAIMREGCIGQLAEIYDGKTPSASKGCFAQAWSVGEILRVYEMLEK